MPFYNTAAQFGWVAILLHWSMALLLYSLFFLGFWMVTLGSYHPYYDIAPYWHISLGLLIGLMWVFRLFWRRLNPVVLPLQSIPKIQNKGAYIIHITLYILIFIICLSGYLLASVTGDEIRFFQLFELNEFEFTRIDFLADNQEQIMQIIHQYSSYLLIILSLIHAIAALMHHFIYQDNTLKRMVYL